MWPKLWTYLASFKLLFVCWVSVVFQGKSAPKTPKSLGKSFFAETRSFWHIFRSFDRLWTFLILALQVHKMKDIIEIIRLLYWMNGRVALQIMIVIAWSDVSIFNIFQPANVYYMSSIFITAAFLRVIQSMLLLLLCILSKQLKNIGCNFFLINHISTWLKVFVLWFVWNSYRYTGHHSELPRLY